MPNGPRPTLLCLAAGALLLAGARSVVAAPYPARSCVARKLEAAAGTACRKALEAEGRNVAFPKRDPQRRRLATTRNHVRARLLDALPAGCYPGFEAALADAAEAIIDQIAVRLQTAPHVPSTWAMYSPPSDVEYNGQTLHPICARGTPSSFWARRGTVNKLVVYYQGGGACFSNLSCAPAVHAFKDSAGPGDDPTQYTEGIANVTNPDNPFRDWNAVFVSYCTGDIHWGDATVTYEAPDAPPVTINHRGAENARVVEKWAREHFVNPEEVFVTGSSGGSAPATGTRRCAPSCRTPRRGRRTSATTSARGRGIRSGAATRSTPRRRAA